MGEHTTLHLYCKYKLKLILFLKWSNRISLARSLEDIPKDENIIVQEYVDKVYFFVCACTLIIIGF